ncbi:hypothetical protein GCM10009837_53120 [Streptomyces durmitorensis]|uniref:Uncharacterized protein n=1 Tax=Streptomyces durmitorensis TaxID=319947 RepID=A0ABY4PV60_9ACTN|nr:hypothetical protein [Streptomyces durmitorensis]UQT57290.1 hypothetical protein M4V62_20515 [Streptomyces durmitorensis]
MFETIRWRCYAHAGDRRSAERVVGRIEKLLPCPFEIVGYQRYWKFPELAELRLASPLACSTSEHALLTTLQLAWKIATPWSLLGSEAGAPHEFEGIASANVSATFSVVGIEWMEFTITDRPEDTAAETPA